MSDNPTIKATEGSRTFIGSVHGSKNRPGENAQLHAVRHDVRAPHKQTEIATENSLVDKKISEASNSAPAAKNIQEISEYKDKAQKFIEAVFNGWHENAKEAKKPEAQKNWVIKTVDTAGNSFVPQIKTLPSQAGRLPVFEVEIELNMDANKLTLGKHKDYKNEDATYDIAHRQFFDEHAKFQYERETMLFGKGELNTMSDRYDIHMKFEYFKQVQGELYKKPTAKIYFIPKSQ
jgi:uncharacterized protein YaaR (DUF327 family)